MSCDCFGAGVFEPLLLLLAALVPARFAGAREEVAAVVAALAPALAPVPRDFFCGITSSTSDSSESDLSSNYSISHAQSSEWSVSMSTSTRGPREISVLTSGAFIPRAAGFAAPFAPLPFGWTLPDRNEASSESTSILKRQS